MTTYTAHVKKAVTWLTPYVDGMELPEGCSVSDEDKANGSPKVGDYIGIDRDNTADTWLVGADYYNKTYKVPNPRHTIEL